MADPTYASAKEASRQLARLFWILLALNFVFIFWSRNFLRPLDTSEIVRFETAKTVPTAEAILHSWSVPDDTKLAKAKQSINIDYIFILLYTAGLSIASIYLSSLTRHPILKRAGRFMPFLLLVAGICDVIENVAMLNSLNGNLTGWNVFVTYDMAVTKFSIVILALIFVLICLVFFGLSLISRKQPISLTPASEA